MKKQTLMTIAVVFTVITMTGTAFAWNGCGRKANAKGWGGQGFAQQWTQLTDEQKNQLKKLRQQFIDESAEARASMVAKHEQIRILMETSAPDRAKLKMLSNQLADLTKEVMNKKLEMALAAKEIAPDINIPMGFHGMGKSGTMGMGRGQGWGGCEAKGKRGCLGHKGYGRVNCPLAAGAGDSSSTSTE